MSRFSVRFRVGELVVGTMTREHDFSEAVKKEAKARAHYSCAMCHRPGFLHVHHIDAQKDGGSDDIGNAAPLCPDCHALYGDNPVMRKQIRAMRDFWWDHCTRVATNPSMTAAYERLDGIQVQLTEMRQDDRMRHSAMLIVLPHFGQLDLDAVE